jgi:Rps23 Pro-64 3,4-dihydroxylase Tpa1-like proline 4-hydroxylase
VEDVYTSEELSLIWEELDFLNKPEKLLSPGMTESATDSNGRLLKNNKGIFLDQIYGQNRQVSNILTVNRKLFNSSILNAGESWFFNGRVVVKDFTLISYYEEGGNYLPHSDDANLTALTWLFKEPRKFRGGDLTFTKFALTLPLKNNFMVIFPSQVIHEVSNVEAESLSRGEGRYCISQFCHFY